MGVFSQLPLPITPSISSSKTSMCMISSGTYGPHRTPDPLVALPIIIEDDQPSEHPPPLVMEEISSPTVLSVPLDTGQKLHPNMEYDQVIFPTQATPPPIPHDSLDDQPPRLVKLEVMGLPNDNPREIFPMVEWGIFD